MTLKSLKECEEDLIQQVQNQRQSEKNTFEEGIKKGIADSFHSFSELIATYIKYKSNVKLLMSDEKHIWKKWVQYYEQQPNISKSDYINNYNIWLFEYLFCNTVISEEIFTSLY